MNIIILLVSQYNLILFWFAHEWAIYCILSIIEWIEIQTNTQTRKLIMELFITSRKYLYYIIYTNTFVSGIYYKI